MRSSFSHTAFYDDTVILSIFQRSRSSNSSYGGRFFSCRMTGFRCQVEIRCQVSGARCQWQSFRIDDTVNSTLVANKFFVFILNHTPSYTVDNSYAMPFGCRSGFNRDLLWQISNKCKFIDIYSLYSSLLTPDSSFLIPLSYFLFLPRPLFLPLPSFFILCP